MNVNENRENIKYVCGICGCELGNNETFFGVDDNWCCKRCAAGKPDAVPYRAFDGKAMRLITRVGFGSLPNGIYKVKLYKGMILIRERLENADSRLIRELTDDYGCYILEKRTEGFMFRFHTIVYTYCDFFNIMDHEYEELDNLIDRRGESDLKVICEDKFVIGISVVPRAGVYKKRFACYENGFVLSDLCDVGVARCDAKGFTKEVTEMKSRKNDLPLDMLGYFRKRIMGQDEELQKIVMFFCEFLRKAESGEKFTAPNWILTAPSGCGKTEVYRTVRDFFQDRGIDIPVLQIDLSLFSEAGYKGREVSEIIDAIAAANDKGNGTAIVFLDEADKKFVPSIGSSGADYNAAAQANLLTLIEGSTHERSKRGISKQTIDTNKTMFVFMGAFQSIRDSRQKKHTDKRRLGFGAEYETNSRSTDRFYDDITIEDMIEFGMIEELAGRMEYVINLHRLPEKDMRQLITEKARIAAADMGIEIELDEDAVTSFLDVAYTNLGIRGVTNRIKRLVCEKLANVYFTDDFDRSKCIVRIISADFVAAVGESEGSCEFTA